MSTLPSTSFIATNGGTGYRPTVMVTITAHRQVDRRLHKTFTYLTSKVGRAEERFYTEVYGGHGAWTTPYVTTPQATLQDLVDAAADDYKQALNNRPAA